MARNDVEQLALRPPAGTKNRLLALKRERETLLSVVLRAVAALEQLKAPQRSPAPVGNNIGLEPRLDTLEATVGDVLHRLERLESTVARPELVEGANTGGAPAPELDRIPDAARCECRTSKGERCRNKAVEVIRVRVDGGIAEYGNCKRHKRYFEPHESVM